MGLRETAIPGKFVDEATGEIISFVEIKPTIGRIVWFNAYSESYHGDVEPPAVYHSGKKEDPDRCYVPAIVVFVHEDGAVDLQVFGLLGHATQPFAKRTLEGMGPGCWMWPPR